MVNQKSQRLVLFAGVLCGVVVAAVIARSFEADIGRFLLAGMAVAALLVAVLAGRRPVS